MSRPAAMGEMLGGDVPLFQTALPGSLARVLWMTQGAAIADAARLAEGGTGSPIPEAGDFTVDALLAKWGMRLTPRELAEHYAAIERAARALATCATDCTGCQVPAMSRDAASHAPRWGYHLCDRGREAAAERRRDELVVAARMPTRLRDITFDTYRPRTASQRDALERARSLAGAELAATGIVLAGPTGVGKTHLIAAIANQRRARGRALLFAKAPDVLANLRDGVKTDQTEKILDELRRVPLLLLDDLGAERSTEFGLECLYRLIDHRVSEKLTMVVTTNADEPSRLVGLLSATRQGDSAERFQLHARRIVSRLREGCDWIVVTGKDARADGGRG